MVYSVFYYASEAITRAIVGLTLKIVEHRQRQRMVTEKEVEEEIPAPTWGFFATTNPHGEKEYTWVGKSTGLKVSIPGIINVPVKAHDFKKPPTRLYFSFSEATSKDWFKEIEWLAEQAEKPKQEKPKETKVGDKSAT